MKTSSLLATAASVALAALTSLACRGDDAPATTTPAPKTREWQLLASELPSALLSVSGRSASDIFAVGADKGHGPLVLHYDGKAWKELQTGQTGDLWWVHAFPNGPVLMRARTARCSATTAQKFERMSTPGLGKHTVYGVWGTRRRRLLRRRKRRRTQRLRVALPRRQVRERGAPGRPAAHRGR